MQASLFTIPMLKGKPVMTMKRGHFPNKQMIQQIAADHPHCTVRTEIIHTPFTTFVVTAQPSKY